jgi:hypothetical protein
MKKSRKIKWGGAAWHREAYHLARWYAPPITPCMKCSYPVLKGYCCGYCGDINPSRPPEAK